MKREREKGRGWRKRGEVREEDKGKDETMESYEGREELRRGYI